MGYTYPKIISCLSEIKISLGILYFIWQPYPQTMSGELLLILPDTNQASLPPGSPP